MNTLFRSEGWPWLLCPVLLAACMTTLLAQEAGQKDTTTSTVPPLYLAAKQGRLAEVRDLIAEGQDINAVNATGRSALMSAVFYRNRGIVRELLIEGADVNSADGGGRTALMMAVSNEDMEMVNMLLAAGADARAADKAENTALSLAERSKNKALLKLIKEAAK